MAEEIIDKEIGEVLPMDELEVGTVSIIPMQDAFVHNSDNMVMCTFDTDGSKASKLRLHKIKANPDERLQDHINEKNYCYRFCSALGRNQKRENRRDHACS